MATAVSATTTPHETESDRCGFQTAATGEPCQNPAGDDGRCWLATHSDDPDAPDREPDGRGAPKGNQNAVGNAGGGAPKGNQNAVRHGLYAADRNPCGLYRYYQKSEPERAESIRRWFWSYLDATPRERPRRSITSGGDPPTNVPDAPRPVDPARLRAADRRLFVACVRQAAVAAATTSQAADGLTVTVTRSTPDGRKYTVERENPVNRVKSRLRAATLRVLAERGVFDDTETAEQRWIEAAERFAEGRRR